MTHDSSIPLSRISVTNLEIQYLLEALRNNHVQGDGPFTTKSQNLLQERIGSQHVLLTHSCTAALEMAAILADIQPGDEVVMPSFTFVSTANAFVLRGAVPVFVDIRQDTLNLDETKIERALTKKTRAIVPVHYAGVGCEMDVIGQIGKTHSLAIIEDAAQGIGARWRGKPLGSFGDLAAISFHQSKNLTSGEGGALCINRESLVERACIIREKGTNRRKFLSGLTDKYTWVDVGSSYLPSDLLAALLTAQLERCDDLNERRHAHYRRYQASLAELADRELLALPHLPADAQHNAHIFYVLLRSGSERGKLQRLLNEEHIGAAFHYVPLHSSPAGRRFGRANGTLATTDSVAERLLRLPLSAEMQPDEIDRVVELVRRFFKLSQVQG